MGIVGLDEVGRGCWAGPLVAAAVVLDAGKPIIVGLNDSKQLSKARRELLNGTIRAEALSIGVGWVWPEYIDAHGLTAAVKSAMEQAMTQIQAKYSEIIIDGNYNFLPEYAKYAPVRTVIGGDGIIPAISAASIVAKVARDTYMSDVAAGLYPKYGFDKHVGYGTALHVEMLKLYGVTELHRRSYKPIQRIEREYRKI